LYREAVAHMIFWHVIETIQECGPFLFYAVSIIVKPFVFISWKVLIYNDTVYNFLISVLPYPIQDYIFCMDHLAGSASYHTKKFLFSPKYVDF